MPELPDLLHITKYLNQKVVQRAIVATLVKEPIILRVAIDQPFDDLVTQKTIEVVGLHGPFIRFELTDSIDVVINLMLAGKLQHRMPGGKAEGHLCCAFHLDDGSYLNLCDQEKMAKLYLVHHGKYDAIPKYNTQGIDIRSSQFTPEVFIELARKHSRKQVRVFINDHSVLSSIGNAYADEILFEAQIHPKTFVSRLSEPQLDTLYNSIRSVMEWGSEKVEEAGQPIHIKVREHMKVRNRKGESCPRCGGIIRREGVRGHDVFFCPVCQPASRKMFIDWSKTPKE